MARLLYDLLGVTNHSFDTSIQRLESASGNSGRDVRLSAEIIGKSHLAVKSLGLDPHDSSAAEVYAGLADLVRRHDEFMVKQLGGDDSSDVADLLPRIHAFAQKINIPRTVWGLKHSVAKRLLKNKIPKRSMRALGYRSIDSMLKREPVSHIVGVALHLETDTWQAAFYEQYDQLVPQDFEQRPVELCFPKSRYWGELGIAMSSKLQTNVVGVRELGALLILPLPQKKLPGTTIALLVLLLSQIEELRMYSSYFRLHQMHPAFGKKIRSILQEDAALRHGVIPEPHNWKILHTYFGAVPKSEHPEFFEPHVTLEDLAWRKAEEVLFSIEPALGFWRDNDFVGGFYAGSSAPISFSLMDAALNYANAVPLEKRIVHNMRSSLWDEILIRYMDSNHVRSQALRYLDHGTIDAKQIMENTNFAIG